MRIQDITINIKILQVVHKLLYKVETELVGQGLDPAANMANEKASGSYPDAFCYLFPYGKIL